MEINILPVPVFFPLIVGFVLLFLPNTIKSVSRALTLIISVLTFVLGIQIFAQGEAEYTWSILQIGEVQLDLLLSVTPLGGFILMFAMGFGLLITLYSLKSVGPSAKRVNEYYGAVLITMRLSRNTAFQSLIVSADILGDRYCFTVSSDSNRGQKLQFRSDEKFCHDRGIRRRFLAGRFYGMGTFRDICDLGY